ncbi:MAG: hypothetical protein P4M04_12840 [Acidobacteriota bacterium]|nr:hypothetical protein [Acidobacteriota bacterium]
MPIDLTGITNENEFYTHHYLAAILEGDLKSTFESWAQQERPPWEAIKALARPFQLIERESDPVERQALRQKWFADFFGALGYQLVPEIVELEGGTLLTVAGQIARPNGQPELWILEALNGSEDEDPLAAQEELLTKQVFAAAEPPRWVLLYGAKQLLLIDRTKWPSKRFLRFNLADILGRREPFTLKATAALLHRDSVCPPDQVSLLDRLDENSHKHAFAVSEDLKYSAREAVELLGNEAVWYLREVLKEGVYGKDLAEQLTRECLRYLYRLLFLFYVEAREELGYAPMKSAEYRTGYSLESLRDAAEMDLSTDEDRNGYFLHHSLQALFRLIHDGWLHGLKPELIGDYNFRMEPLRCDLFDPVRTPLLNRVRLRNHVLQNVIELLSLSREARGQRRGRISYSQLGINQLGAVYEGLLSYTGFFVEEKDGLYEVKPEGEPPDPLKQAYFVPKAALAEYKEEEKVYESGRLVHHPQGSFVYRLAGRNRQKSASYYTPDVLTQCVVKYALKELLKDKSADDILSLNVCEPALGSGAFLNEAVNQLADAYLDRKQRETARVIGHDDYLLEKQKVKAYLADNNVYGVDRNPVAIELAEVSLWLNTIYEGHTIPWFGGQLVAGNSLIGARRQVFTRKQLESQNREWLDAIPDRVPLGQERKSGQIWHFLVPDQGMADYTDRAVKEMLPTEMKQIREWRKGFTKRFSASDTRALERLSAAVDHLWKKHCEDLRQVRRETAHIFPVFGQESNPVFAERGQRLTTHQRDLIFERDINPGGGQASAYQRLKLAMDYWCSLWFWPIDQADLLPSIDEFLLELSAVLEGTSEELSPLLGPEQQPLFATGKPEQEQLRMAEDLGSVNLDELCASLPRLKRVRELAGRQRFLHWELEFADLFEEHGGFDLVLGNPPWIKIEWNEVAVMGDTEPIYVLRKFSAPRMKQLREETMRRYPGLKAIYTDEYVEFEGTQNYLNGKQNYPILIGTQANSYKCFLTQAWMACNDQAVQGFLHPEGVYDDPNGGQLRSALYPRLRSHFHFRNELLLFAEIGDTRPYSINIYGSMQAPEFDHISTLFHPSTIDTSFSHDGSGICGGIKTKDDEWNIEGHRSRIIRVTNETLGLFSRLYDVPDTPATQGRLPSLHSNDLVPVLRCLANCPHRLRDLEGEYSATKMQDETNWVVNGMIRRDTKFADSLSESILSGPHVFVANPLFKTPRHICTEKGHYDPLDLTVIPPDYRQRTNYVPDCELEVYKDRLPRVAWSDQRPVTDYYRVAIREMLSQAGERTLISAIIPKGPAHISTLISVAFLSTSGLLDFASMAMSLPIDFLVKSTGQGHASKNLVEQLPILGDAARRPSIWMRSLMLNCLTSHYSELWVAGWHESFRQERWSKVDVRLQLDRFAQLNRTWHWSAPLRTDYERRQALIEIDVLAARALGLTRNELCAIYRIQFPVLRQNEQDTWYDQRGRMVFTSSKALPGVGFSRPEWERIKTMSSGVVTRTIQDDTLPGGPRERVIEYLAPFDRCDREADYTTAWKFFDEVGA